MGIEKFVVFDNVSAGVKPKKKPAPNNNPTLKQRIDAKGQTPTDKKTKPKPKKEKVIEVDKHNDSKLFASKAEQEATIITLNRLFDKEDKLGKVIFDAMFKNKKTILGDPIRFTDKVVSVLEIMPDTIMSEGFTSVSPRLTVNSELKMVAKKYVSVNPDRRVPALVEAKYMNSEHYPKHRQHILNEFL